MLANWRRKRNMLMKKKMKRQLIELPEGHTVDTKSMGKPSVAPQGQINVLKVDSAIVVK
jgi:hypothetical protein